MVIREGVPIFRSNDLYKLKLLVEHIERDLSYGEGGSFGDTNDKKRQRELDKEALHVEEALGWIKMIINQNKK